MYILLIILYGSHAVSMQEVGPFDSLKKCEQVIENFETPHMGFNVLQCIKVDR